MAMLTLVMHPMLKTMTGRDFALFLRAFLPTARKSWFNFLCVAEFDRGADRRPRRPRRSPSGTPFVLTAIGLALTVAGPLLVSSRLAEPNYDVILAWNPEALPPEWEAIRRRRC